MADPQVPEKTVDIAYRGQKINPDDHPVKPGLPRIQRESEFRNFVPEQLSDVNDLVGLNKNINMLLIRMHRIRIELDKAGRKAAADKYKYETERKLRLIALSGASSEARTAMAEIMVDDLYKEVIVSDQHVKELQQLSRDTRTELDGYKEMSNNMRRIIDIGA